MHPPRVAAGSFRGVDGNGVKDFAKIMTDTAGGAFADCAVQRSFEFLLGAAPSAEIRQALWPKFTSAYGDGNVWNVMLSIAGENWLWK